MKIFRIVIICASMVTLISSMAYSASSTQTGGDTTAANAGGEVQVVDADGNFTFTPSPSTCMQIETSSNIYAMTAVSSKTNEENGYHYGVLSSKSAIFQLKVVAGDVTSGIVALQVPTDSSTLPAGFEDKAGNPAGS